jgi:preprotein translocase subunit SecD
VNRFKLRQLLLLVTLLGLSLACVTLTNLFSPAVEIILSPKESAGWDAKTLEQASQIINTRLLENLKGRYNVRVIENSQISVALFNVADLETAKRLATETSAIIFVDSEKSYPAGYELGNLGKIILSQKDIKTATAISDQFKGYQINFVLTSDGAKKMMEYSSNNVGHYLVIARDGLVITSPMINSAIPDGQGVITGKYSLQEAKELASILMSQPLPLSLAVTEVNSP